MTSPASAMASVGELDTLPENAAALPPARPVATQNMAIPFPAEEDASIVGEMTTKPMNTTSAQPIMKLKRPFT